MNRILVAVAAFLICAASAVSAQTQTGLLGFVRKACPGGTKCNATPMRATLVFTRQGNSYRVRSALNGAYRITLPSGTYRVGMIPRIGITAPRIRPAKVI